MKNQYLFGCLLIFGLLAVSVFGQKMVVISDTMKPAGASTPLDVATYKLIQNQILPKMRKHWTSETCTEEIETTGFIKGSFTKPDSKQMLVFIQFCQTGNGMGNNGLVLIEDGKIAASYISEGGWALNIESLPDINQNGLNEIALYYSGGMHQGEGGTGVDVWEFSGANLKGIGWFQADSFNEHQSLSYKISAKTGKLPTFYREKYQSIEETKWKKLGTVTKFSLGKVACNFTVLK